MCTWIGPSQAHAPTTRTHISLSRVWTHTRPFLLHFHGSEKGSKLRSTTSGGSKTSPLRKPKGACRVLGRGLVLGRRARFVESGLGRGAFARTGGTTRRLLALSYFSAAIRSLWGSGEIFEIRSIRPRQERPRGFWGLSIISAWDSVVLDWDSGGSVGCDCCDAE